MNWVKKGLLFNVSGTEDWAASHCHKPTPLLIDNDTIRIFFGVRDSTRHTRTTFLDAKVLDDGSLVVSYVHDRPVLDLGTIGAFDDSGVNVCSLVRRENTVYMYYIGWNPSTTVHTRNSIGLAVSADDGITFQRLYQGAVLDRNKDEPFYTGAVDVRCELDGWKLWYTSGTEWKIINSKPEICYHVKYATSVDGVDWIRRNQSCILPASALEAVARPCVLLGSSGYKMWYSRRLIDGFRLNPKNGYRGGYAESQDGMHWKRMDSAFGIDVSQYGWDSEAIAYPYLLGTKVKGYYFMFYNGNGFGQSGFGYAVSKDDI